MRLDLPHATRVGFDVIRHMTDNLANIEVFVEEHGAHSVLTYLLAKYPDACPWRGCGLSHEHDGTHSPIAGVVEAEIVEDDGEPTSRRLSLTPDAFAAEIRPWDAKERSAT